MGSEMCIRDRLIDSSQLFPCLRPLPNKLLLGLLPNRLLLCPRLPPLRARGLALSFLRAQCLRVGRPLVEFLALPQCSRRVSASFSFLFLNVDKFLHKGYYFDFFPPVFFGRRFLFLRQLICLRCLRSFFCVLCSDSGLLFPFFVLRPDS